MAQTANPAGADEVNFVCITVKVITEMPFTKNLIKNLKKYFYVITAS